MTTIFCPQCDNLILDQPACAACGWQRPIEAGDAGKEVWRAELGRQLARPHASAVVAGGRYCLAAEDGTVVALDLDTGQVAWERAIDGGNSAHALATDGARLFVSSVDLRPLPVAGRPLLALDAGTGADLWQYATEGHSLSAAVVADGTAYFASSDGRLHAVDPATGHAGWVVSHAPWGPGAPAASRGVICAGGRGEALVAYAAGDGAELWRFLGSGWFTPQLHLADSQVYAACWDGNLYALDAHTGFLRWKVKGERGEGITSPPAAAGDRVLIGSRVYRDMDGQASPAYALLALRAADGAEAWRCFTGRHVFAQPAGAGDLALAGADDGFLYALDLASGAERWKCDLNGRIVTSPQVAGDLVYVGERHGTAYALRRRAATRAPLQPPEVYLRQDEHEHAAVAYALRGDLDAAAAIYAGDLGQRRHAAQLYERAGRLDQAAQLWEAEGELRRARDLYQEAGSLDGVARMLDRAGQPLEAAKIYEQIGAAEAAAALYEQTGDRVKAADLYYLAGRAERAAQIWRSLGQWEPLVDAVIAEGNLAEAAGILEQHDQFERAADLYEAAGQHQEALRLRLRLQHWERVADLAARIENYEQAAAAHERLGQLPQAAEAYEQAAQQRIAAAPADEERVATCYERAAQLYHALSEEKRAAACRRQVRRYRRLPELVVSGGAQDSFAEYEWNTLKLRVRNAGYGPAANISVALRGAFDVGGTLDIASLAPNKTVAIEAYVRPQRGQYGPAVPLEIVVTYEDLKGNIYPINRRVPIRVVQQGAAHGTTTPLEIQIRGDRLPQAPERGEELSAGPAAAPPRAVLAASQDEIDQQQSLLTIHRRTLADRLRQQAIYGPATEPYVLEAIRQDRVAIERIKGILRGWGVPVADHPDDISS